ncbi:MAG: exosome complex RNA-binding protein Rrp4 [Nitrososphaerota archaeon]
MSKIRRKFVVPGDLIVRGDYKPVANVYREGNSIYSLKVGLSEIEGRRVRVIPLSGRYAPRVNDVVVGIITDINPYAWTVDINSFFSAFLPATDVFGKRFSPERDDLTSRLKLKDVILAQIISFDRSKDPMLSAQGPRLGPIRGGHLVKISPVKVPRLIGRKGSMTRMIEEATGTRIIIGQNGYVVINGPPEKIPLAIKSIEMVEAEAHLAGLTENIQNFLSKSLGRKIESEKFDGE